MKRILLPAAVAVAVAFLLYILFPLTHKRWQIQHDQRKIVQKKNVLDRLAGSAKAVSVGTRMAGRPNVIILLADDLGKTDISMYGGTVKTPNIDSIGMQGAVFTDAYCTSSICSPSRSALLTGRYQQRFGNELQIQERYPHSRFEYFIYKHFIKTGDWVLRDMERYPDKRSMKRQGPPLSEILLPELFKAAGYATAITGKWHQGWDEDMVPTKRGFDYQYGFYEAYSLFAPVESPDIVNSPHAYFADKHIWSRGRTGTCAIRRNEAVIDEQEYLTASITNEAIAFIEKHKDEPFFLYVPYSAPHTPFQAPKSFVERFASEPDLNKRVYYAMISALDDEIGRILSALNERGLSENTLVFFASDNGGATYTGATENAPLKGGKFTLFEGGLNVPMMMMWRGKIEEGRVVNEPVTLMDVFATSAAAAGIPLPEDRHYDCANLLPLVAIPHGAAVRSEDGGKAALPERNQGNGQTAAGTPGEQTAHIIGSGGAGRPLHDALYFRSGFNKAIRQGKWKLLVFGKDKRIELYDLENDRNEKHDLAAEYPDIVKSLEAKLLEWETGLQDPLWPSVMDFRAVLDGKTYHFQL